MIKDIVTDIIALRCHSEPADKSDRQIITDLTDTLRANSDRCVGMAANMIGYNKTILIAADGSKELIMVNPKITDHSKKSYTAEEGCLSLTTTRQAFRWESITVEYLDKKFKRQKKTFSGLTAQIIQHEMDHFKGEP